jgi:hypothetical protein
MCAAPSELLLFTLKETGEVGFVSLTGAQSHDLTLAGRSPQPSAVNYDPIEQVNTPAIKTSTVWPRGGHYTPALENVTIPNTTPNPLNLHHRKS